MMDEDSQNAILAHMEHIGKGKFLVREAESPIYTGRIIDASNVFSCRA